MTFVCAQKTVILLSRNFISISLIGSLKSKMAEIRHLESLFVCLHVCRQNAKMRFYQKQGNLELLSLLTTYSKLHVRGLFKKPIIGPLKSKMAEIRHLENRHDVIFFLPRLV